MFDADITRRFGNVDAVIAHTVRSREQNASRSAADVDTIIIVIIIIDIDGVNATVVIVALTNVRYFEGDAT